MSTDSNKITPVNIAFSMSTIGQLTKTSPICPQEPDEKKVPSRRASIIREFCLNTSTHGLPGIARSQSTPNRFFWCISLLSFTGFMLYLIITAILAYLAYPTKIDIDIVGEWPQIFPAFSLCNLGIIRFDQFIGPFINYTNTLGITNTNDTSIITPYQALYIGAFMRYETAQNRSMDPFYFSLSSMLHKCIYNGQQCSAADFIQFTTGTYGLCHTFNARLMNSSSKIRFGNDNGGDGRLELSLYLHSHQYLPYMNDDIGLVVLVHDNKEVPMVDATGTHLIPGRKHRLGFRKQTNYFLPSPYTSCADQPPFSMDTVLLNYPQAHYSYSQALCYRYVIQVYTYNRCGCVNPYMWEIRLLILPETQQLILAPLCDVVNTCYVNASINFMSTASAQETNPSYNCPQQCSTTNFIIHKSSSVTPMEWQMDSIKNFVENSSVPLPSDWSQTWQTHIRENYVLINLVRETTVVENRTQSAATSLVDVLSNIGGQMGLWIGISLLSFMELMEMLFRLIRYELSVMQLARQRNQ